MALSGDRLLFANKRACPVLRKIKALMAPAKYTGIRNVEDV